MVLDIKLPDITGWEVLKQIRGDLNITPVFPVLIMTASIMDAYVDSSSYPMVRKVLIKPFSSRQLLTAVEGALENSGRKSP
jgi:CheY-like chemotaxis protein